MRQAICIGPLINEERVILYEHTTSNGVITGYILVYDMAEGPHDNPQTLNFSRCEFEKAEKAWVDRVSELINKYEKK
jgi:hypothetical protein